MRRHRAVDEQPQLRFERDERFVLKPLAATPYPRLHRVLPSLPSKKPVYPVEVQHRALSFYAEIVR